MTRSGTPSTPSERRSRPPITITLSTEAIAWLADLAAERGQTRSGCVEQLIRDAIARAG
jgi:hypothetical protein